MNRSSVVLLFATLSLSPAVAQLANSFDSAPDTLTRFRFVATIALLTFLASISQHAIWFRSRITGHVIESIAYLLIAGGIFAFLWPFAA